MDQTAVLASNRLMQLNVPTQPVCMEACCLLTNCHCFIKKMASCLYYRGESLRDFVACSDIKYIVPFCISKLQILDVPNRNLQTRPGEIYTVNCSLIPRPHPVFNRFQYGKAGEGLVMFSHVSDVRIDMIVLS